MTTDEAIKVLQFQGAPEEGPSIHDFIEARNLGIEALKKWKEYRASDKSWWGNLLPGETEA